MIKRLQALTQAEKDELMHLVLEQLTYQAKQNFAKADVINLGMIIKLIELSIANLTGDSQIKLHSELNTLKLQMQRRNIPDNDQLALDMFNNSQQLL